MDRIIIGVKHFVHSNIILIYHSNISFIYTFIKPICTEHCLPNMSYKINKKLIKNIFHMCNIIYEMYLLANTNY